MKGQHLAHWAAAGTAFAAGLFIIGMEWPGLLLNIVLASWAIIATVWLAATRDSLWAMRARASQVERLRRINMEIAERHAQSVYAVTRGCGDRRIGDADRDAALERLRASYATGHLNYAELDERMTAALAAVVRADLVPLLHDLPLTIEPSGTPR